jgi:glutaredoxin
MTAQRIVVYAQSGLMFCRGVKEFLSQRGVQFIERDVAQDAGALAELEALGL